MKRWIFICTLAVAVCWAFGVSAADVAAEGGSIRIVDGVVESYEGDPVHVVIPEEADGVPVTEIADYAFGYCESLVSVQIPDTVTRIGGGAFEMCINLETVQLPRRPVVYDEAGKAEAGYFLDEFAFKGCKSLKRVDLTGVTWLGMETFAYCFALTEVTLDPALWCINAGAFYNCTSLEQLEIPAAVTYMGTSVFEHTPFDRSLTEDVAILGKVLYRCNQQISGAFVVPDDVTCIAENAFAGQTGLTEVSFGDALQDIGNSAFQDCTSLKKVTFSYQSSEEVGIGFYAFWNCASLQHIVLPADVEWVGDCAFSGCTALQSVTFLSTVGTILTDAFVDCPNLRAVYVGTAVRGLELSTFSTIFEPHTVIYYDGAKDSSWDDYTVRPQPALMPCGYTFLQDGAVVDGVPAAGSYQLRAALCPGHEARAAGLFPMTAYAAFYQGDRLLRIQSYSLTADDWHGITAERVDVGELTLPVTVPEGANRARLLLWSSGGLRPLTVEGWIQ